MIIMIIIILSLVLGFIFSIVSITVGIILSKNKSFIKTIDKVNDKIRPEGSIYPHKSKLKEAEEELVKKGEAYYEGSTFNN